MRRKWNEANRDGIAVFFSEGQFQQQGDLRHQPAVLDPENSSGTNYAVEVWEDKPRQVALMSEVALTVIGVVSKNGGVPAETSRGGGPGCGDSGCGVGCYRCRRTEKGAESSTRFGARERGETTPFTIPFTTHPQGWLLRVGLEGG
jgi:hypothetical protein